jgi:hypothetical protein
MAVRHTVDRVQLGVDGSREALALDNEPQPGALGVDPVGPPPPEATNRKKWVEVTCHPARLRSSSLNARPWVMRRSGTNTVEMK